MYLIKFLELMKMNPYKKQLILASTSPQRRNILQQMGCKFKIMAPTLENEYLNLDSSLEEAVAHLAYLKASSIECHDEAYIIGCDTIVTIDDFILGKPKNREEAFEMLTRLSGRSHFVKSGIAFINHMTQEFRVACDSTEVFFKKLSKAEINRYLDTEEYINRAGSYAIQIRGVLLTNKINGSWFNVVGLPVERLADMFCSFGEDLMNYGQTK